MSYVTTKFKKAMHSFQISIQYKDDSEAADQPLPLFGSVTEQILYAFVQVLTESMTQLLRASHSAGMGYWGYKRHWQFIVSLDQAYSFMFKNVTALIWILRVAFKDNVEVQEMLPRLCLVTKSYSKLKYQDSFFENHVKNMLEAVWKMEKEEMKQYRHL